MPRDYLLRQADGGTDYIGRDVTATLDFMGRELVLAWATATAYAVGDYVELSTGEALRCTVAGTSDGTTEPTAPGFGDTVVDGTVTWEQYTV